MRNILLLPLVARCLETLNVCIWRMFVFISVVLSLGVLKYIVCLCNGCCVFYLYCEAWSCRCSCMGSADVVCLCLVCILW